MEVLQIVLSIVASVLSITSTIVAFICKREMSKFKNSYGNIQQSSVGAGSTQIVGNNNSMNKNNV